MNFDDMGILRLNADPEAHMYGFLEGYFTRQIVPQLASQEFSSPLCLHLKGRGGLSLTNNATE